MDTKHKTRYRSSLIAKRFADAELLLPSPWNFDTPDASKQVTPSSDVRPSPVTPFNVRGRDLSRSQQPRDRSRSRQPDVISTLQRLIAAGKDPEEYIASLPAGDKKAARVWLRAHQSNKGGGALSSKRVSGRAFGGGRKTHRRRKLPKLL